MAKKPDIAALTVSRPELLVDGSDLEFSRLVHSLYAFFARCELIRNSYAEMSGLPGPQYSILRCIRHLNADGPVNVKTVAEHLYLSGSFIAAETRKLEEVGLLSKAENPKDRRQTVLQVTKKGRDLLDSLAPIKQQVNNTQFGCLSREQFHDLIPLVEQLIEGSDQAIALQNYLRLGAGTPGEPAKGPSRPRVASGVGA